MLDKLTQSETQKLKEYKAKWLEIGLCTKPANRVEAEKGIELAYKIAKLPKPKKIWSVTKL